MVTQTKPRALVIGNYRGRAGIIQALRGSPFDIVEATEGRRGIKHVLEDAPSVVILSGSSRDAGHLNLLRAIRCLTTAPILVIGSGRETCANEFLFHGANGFVPYCRRFEMTPVYINTLLSRNSISPRPNRVRALHPGGVRSFPLFILSEGPCLAQPGDNFSLEEV